MTDEEERLMRKFWRNERILRIGLAVVGPTVPVLRVPFAAILWAAGLIADVAVWLENHTSKVLGDLDSTRAAYVELKTQVH